MSVAAHHSTPRNAAYSDPHPSKAQFRGLAARVALAREQERAAVARQLHDELGQELTALKYELVHTSRLLVEAGVPRHLVCRLLLEKNNDEMTTGAVRRPTQILRAPAHGVHRPDHLAARQQARL